MTVSPSAAIDLNTVQSFFTVVEFDSFSAVNSLMDKRDNITAAGYHYFIAPTDVYGMQWNGTGGIATITGTGFDISANLLSALSSRATKATTATLYQNLTTTFTGSLGSPGTSVNAAALLIGAHKDDSSLDLFGHISEYALLNILVSNDVLGKIVNNEKFFFAL